ncbi:MAG: exodeoxyribonuclease VII small subunit [Cohaesibacteraceae bacterium]|nr:exodeoxyribonuclease VII small subunit [Cohaesibacteraceae bacterium]
MTELTSLDQMSFEVAMQELETIVASLEKGAVPLEESIRIYERGEALKKHCESVLKSAEEKVEKIRFSANGANETTPMDVD